MKNQKNIRGLTDIQVIKSREKHGANIITPPAGESMLRRFLQKFRDPLIIILMVAGALSLGISIYEYVGLGHGASVFFEPMGIFVAIFLSTFLAFIFEARANREFSILNRVNDDDPVHVIRNGAPTQIPKKDVVVGDIIILNTGQEIPADAELIDATMLSVDESSLTGEPIANKTINPTEFDKDATFPSNQIYRGTKVMSGHGMAHVTAVGDATENGRVFVAAQISNDVKTPLDIQLSGLGNLVTKISYIFAGLIIVGRMAQLFGGGAMADASVAEIFAYVLQTLMLAVTLVVVAVPEGLPMAVTLALAYSMRRMLKTNNLVRKLHACETMGAITVICTDKTGTLTQNQMRVYETQFFGMKNGDKIPTKIADTIVANAATELDFSHAGKIGVLGNPTAGAMLIWLHDNGIDYRDVRDAIVKQDEIPFSTERKYSASVIVSSDTGKKMLVVTGAPEIVLGMCNKIENKTSRKQVQEILLSYQKMAMRTLGFAYREIAPGDVVIDDGKIIARDLTFMGVAAISDPVRPDVPAAIAECQDAGISVKIVTGDTAATAMEIGRQIGLWTASDGPKNIITGEEIEKLTDAQLRQIVMRLKIIARARPMDKQRLVTALQANGAVVAVTGDGTNDAPALRAAHVGLSMGDGTSVAKEASDITIIDNSFASIGRAVMWGRSLYQNIQRFIMFQMTVNVSACLTVLAGAFFGARSPITVTQMLWVNLIMDTFAAMALASLPPSRRVMRECPRSRDAFIISPRMFWNIGIMGVVFWGVLMIMMWVFEHADVTGVGNLWAAQITATATEMTGYEATLFFTTFVMLQFWNMFNARAFYTGRSALHLRGCGGFCAIAALIVGGQMAIVYFGGAFFNTVPISIYDFIGIMAITSPVMWVGEFVRRIGRARPQCAGTES